MKVIDFDNVFKIDVLGKKSITIDLKVKVTPEEANKLYKSWKTASEIEVREDEK